MLPKNRKPTHPGIILQEEFLKPLGWTAAQFITKIGEEMNEKRLLLFIQGKEPFSDSWAFKFAEVLGTTPEFWSHLQVLYYDWESQHKNNAKGSLKPWKKAG